MSVLSELCQAVMSNLSGCLLLLTGISFLEKQKYTGLMIEDKKCGINLMETEDLYLSTKTTIVQVSYVSELPDNIDLQMQLNGVNLNS